jgi:hypothetical protein
LKAREILGIPRDTVVLLTIASSYKYTTFGEYNFVATLQKVLALHDHVLLLAVGPKPEGDWLAASLTLGGRVRALGKQTDLRVYHACADIYLDSFPFSSITSMLEVCAQGIPVLGLSNPNAPIFSDMDIKGDFSLTHQSSLEQYENMLGAMIESPELRREIGINQQKSVKENHLIPGWCDYFKGILKEAPDIHSVDRQMLNTGTRDENDYFLSGFNSLTESTYTPCKAFRKHGRQFQCSTRMNLAIKGLCGNSLTGILPLKVLIGEWPRFIYKRIIAVFRQRDHSGIMRF